MSPALTVPLEKPGNDRAIDITRILETLATLQPAAPALQVPGRTSLTYADLAEQIRYVRERLNSWGVVRGDVIAGVISLRPEMALACATLPAAATFAPLSSSLTIDVYVELLMQLRPKVLKAVFGVELSIELLFRNASTIAAMARAIDSARSTDASADHG